MPRPGGGPPMGQKADFAAERLRMVERLVASRYIQDPRVRDAFLAVPREPFVRPEAAHAPIGPRSGQVLIVATRRPDGSLDIREGTPCAFVPLIGARAWPG